jgi:hypothetical protein
MQLARVIPAIEQVVGNTIERVHADAGYRGHNAPPDYKFKVYTSKSAACPRKSNEKCGAALPSSPSSAISNTSIAWSETISPIALAMPETLSSPQSATSSAS